MPDTPENGRISVYWLIISIYAPFHSVSSYHLPVTMSGVGEGFPHKVYKNIKTVGPGNDKLVLDKDVWFWTYF
jgi:hypothetical protein